ncbi:hypothetical protein, partial [Aeromonas caviae]|uniref:hypothetical protein n=1 Tax=Aeromonas caviae TaxID=648 RepID=UPI0040396AD0
AREAIAENLTLEPIMGKRLNVMDEAHLRRVIEYSAGGHQCAHGASQKARPDEVQLWRFLLERLHNVDSHI